VIRPVGFLLAATFTTAAMLGVASPAQASPYANCSQARSAGDCDIPQSSSNYDPDLDRDGDGVACEC
jgi:hypothetical protein